MSERLEGTGGNLLTVEKKYPGATLQFCLLIIPKWTGVESNVGRNTSVGITTRYGIDGPGIESRWG